MHEPTAMRRRYVAWMLVGIAAVAAAAFVVLTVVVTTRPSLALDSGAFRIADQLRAPWLDHAARLVTTLGLIAVVAPALLRGGGLLARSRHRARAAAVLAGASLAWITVWIIKNEVDRSRPPAPLVHTAGQSYPSAHAANSLGWLALAIALAVVIRSRGGRVAAIACGLLLTVLVGLSRIYLRAHYASDVLGGETLGVTMYALAAIGALAHQRRRSRSVASSSVSG
jgi:membrane-associated phospholipid phosphatase